MYGHTPSQECHYPLLGQVSEEASRKQEEGPLEAIKAGNVEQMRACPCQQRPRLFNVPCVCGFQQAFFLA
eukprot:3621104-Pyramimonas_sp.AAC.1